MSGGSTDTDGGVRDTTNGLWHQYLFTTRPDGQDGYNVYIDGVLRAADPYIEGVGVNRVDKTKKWQTTGGGPTDPTGPIRLCGRAKPGAWVGDTQPVIWDSRRYFLGQVAHFFPSVVFFCLALLLARTSLCNSGSFLWASSAWTICNEQRY